MSAFVVSFKTLARITATVSNVCTDNIQVSESVQKIVKDTFKHCKNVHDIAQRLYRFNMESWNYRYDEHHKTRLKKDFTVNPSEYLFDTSKSEDKPKVLQTIMSMNCWEYQSCEKHNAYQSKWYIAVDLIIRDLMKQIGETTESLRYNEQYHECQWDED